MSSIVCCSFVVDSSFEIPVDIFAVSSTTERILQFDVFGMSFIYGS